MSLLLLLAHYVWSYQWSQRVWQEDGSGSAVIDLGDIWDGDKVASVKAGGDLM